MTSKKHKQRIPDDVNAKFAPTNAPQSLLKKPSFVARYAWKPSLLTKLHKKLNPRRVFSRRGVEDYAAKSRDESDAKSGDGGNNGSNGNNGNTDNVSNTGKGPKGVNRGAEPPENSNGSNGDNGSSSNNGNSDSGSNSNGRNSNNGGGDSEGNSGGGSGQPGVNRGVDTGDNGGDSGGNSGDDGGGSGTGPRGVNRGVDTGDDGGDSGGRSGDDGGDGGGSGTGPRGVNRGVDTGDDDGDSGGRSGDDGGDGGGSGTGPRGVNRGVDTSDDDGGGSSRGSRSRGGGSADDDGSSGRGSGSSRSGSGSSRSGGRRVGGSSDFGRPSRSGGSSSGSSRGRGTGTGRGSGRGRDRPGRSGDRAPSGRGKGSDRTGRSGRDRDSGRSGRDRDSGRSGRDRDSGRSGRDRDSGRSGRDRDSGRDDDDDSGDRQRDGDGEDETAPDSESENNNDGSLFDEPYGDDYDTPTNTHFSSTINPTAAPTPPTMDEHDQQPNGGGSNPVATILIPAILGVLLLITIGGLVIYKHRKRREEAYQDVTEPKSTRPPSDPPQDTPIPILEDIFREQERENQFEPGHGHTRTSVSLNSSLFSGFTSAYTDDVSSLEVVDIPLNDNDIDRSAMMGVDTSVAPAGLNFAAFAAAPNAYTLPSPTESDVTTAEFHSPRQSDSGHETISSTHSRNVSIATSRRTSDLPYIAIEAMTGTLNNLLESRGGQLLISDSKVVALERRHSMERRMRHRQRTSAQVQQAPPGMLNLRRLSTMLRGNKI